MKPVVLSLAMAVLLLISLANHRHESCLEKRFTAPIHNCVTTQSDAKAKGDMSTTAYHLEPVNFSGKYINFFITF